MAQPAELSPTQQDSMRGLRRGKLQRLPCQGSDSNSSSRSSSPMYLVMQEAAERREQEDDIFAWENPEQCVWSTHPGPSPSSSEIDSMFARNVNLEDAEGLRESGVETLTDKIRKLILNPLAAASGLDFTSRQANSLDQADGDSDLLELPAGVIPPPPAPFYAAPNGCEGNAAPKPAQDAPLASLGSYGHPHRCALPCKYAGKKRGCRDGAKCSKCHLCRWRQGTTAPGRPLSRQGGAEIEEGQSSPASVGSIGHPHSCASACKYNIKKAGCKDGKLCTRCHSCRWSRGSERSHKSCSNIVSKAGSNASPSSSFVSTAPATSFASTSGGNIATPASSFTSAS